MALGPQFGDSSEKFSRRRWLASTAVMAGLVPQFGFTSAATADSATGTADDANTDPVHIWDNHIHLSSFAGSSAAEKTDDLLRYADRMGIARLVVFMGWPWSYSPDAGEIRRQNDQVWAALRHAPDRLLGYVYVNPRDTAGSLDEFRRCVVDGPMVGIKLWVAERCDDPAMDPLIELATEHQAVIYQHTWIKTTGNLERESTPAELATLAARHPQARLICGHAGGNWELGIRSIRSATNVVLEIAGSDPTAGITEMAVRDLGADRVIYGSDAGGRSLASQLAKVWGAAVPLEAKRRILGGNLQRMLEPILRAKGMLE